MTKQTECIDYIRHAIAGETGTVRILATDCGLPADDLAALALANFDDDGDGDRAPYDDTGAVECWGVCDGDPWRLVIL